MDFGKIDKKVLNVLRGGGGVTSLGKSPKKYHFFSPFPYVIYSSEPERFTYS